MSRRGLAIVVLAQLAALVAVCLVVGDSGWDDGAITLAFSRTFARHGVVALTPHSEIVEGFSSVSWFLLNSLAALARPSFLVSILIAQLLTALCCCMCTLLLARTCALLRLERPFATLTVVTFAAWGCSFSEASNGMEMGLLALAFLMMVNELLSPRPRTAWLAAGVVLAVTTRFEAMAYVGMLALACAHALPRRRAFWAMLAAGAGTVLLLTGWRLAVFSDVLPNTFWAKRWPPYAGMDVLGRLTGALELPAFFLGPLIALAFLRRSGLDLGGLVQSRRRELLILASPVAAAVAVGALVGKHWGYPGRIPFFAVPLVLPLLAVILSSWVNAARSRRRMVVAAGLFAASLGVSMRGFPSGSLYAAVHGGAFGVTPHTYAESGQVFRRVASAAGLRHPTILTPDLGGLALCCDEFRVVDLGFLSNRALARRGPTALAEVLEAESPAMIEAHWRWASEGKLYELPRFRARYVPAFAGGTRLWLRRDVADTIQREGRGCRMPADRTDLRRMLRAHRYANHDLPGDRTAFASAGMVLVLDEPGGTTSRPCATGQGGPTPDLGK